MRSASRRTRRSAAVVAGLAIAVALAPTPAAVAGLLQWRSSTGNLEYLHLTEFEAHQAHEVQVSPYGDDVRLEDSVSEVYLHASAPCHQDGRHAAICDGAKVGGVVAVLGEQPDVFVNDTSLESFACGADGSDRLTGGAAKDLMAGGPGRDDVDGRGGLDLLAIDLPDFCPAGGAGAGGEVLAGGGGADQIHGGPGADVLDGGDGNDTLRGYGGDDRITGGDGIDDLIGFAGDDDLAGDGGNDIVTGGDGADRLAGGEGHDTLGASVRVDADGPGEGREPTTVVEGGDDILDGGAGDDTLVAGPGESLIDFVDPLAAEQRGARDRTLQSAASNGADILRGGPGVDEATYFNRATPVRVTPDGLADDGSADERDRVDTDVEAVSGGAGDDVLFARPEGSFLFGDLGVDRLVGDAGPDLMRGGAADGSPDVLRGAAGDDELAGGGGDDDIDGGAGRDALVGDDGADLLRGGDDEDTLWGGTGADRLEGGAGADCLHGFLGVEGAAPPSGCPAVRGVSGTSGADGGDVLEGGSGLDRLEGGGGEDIADYSDARGRVLAVLTGAGAGRVARAERWSDRDEIAPDVEGARGGRGADTLLGNARDNLLEGGAGADQIDGGGGADRLRGGPGPDVVVARDGEADEIRCGPARDLAVVDADDEIVVLRADLCELADGDGTEQAARLARVLGRPDCAARVRFPGVARPFDLAVATAVPWGTRVRPDPCGVALRPPGQRRGRAARVRGGAFSLEHGRRGAALTIALRGGKPAAGCARDSRAGLRRLSLTAARTLLVDGHWADVRGGRAAWTLDDRCDGTRVAVQRGRVRWFAGRRGSSGPLRAPSARLVPRRRTP